MAASTSILHQFDPPHSDPLQSRRRARERPGPELAAGASALLRNEMDFNEFSAADPKRLIPMYQLPNLGIETSVAELKRAKKLGFRGVIPAHWPSGEPDLGPVDGPIWAEA